jgi:hypothetical protein
MLAVQYDSTRLTRVRSSVHLVYAMRVINSSMY